MSHSPTPRVFSSLPALLAAGVLSLSGCAVSPLVDWQRPAPTSSPVELEHAQRYADAARAAYQEKRRLQVEATTGLNSTLLGLGALGVALAVANTHRDPLLGTAFIGGTAYAFGQQNLNVQHRLVYEAGIDAIGCAKEAVQPLAMSKGDRDKLDEATTQLEQTIIKTSKARAAVSAQLAARAGGGADLSGAATTAVAAAGTAINTANASVASGRLAIRRANEAGDSLVAAVERIDAAVNKAITATLPDPSSVFKVIAGLPGFAGGIVPGSDAALKAALAKSSAALAPQAGTLNLAAADDQAVVKSLMTLEIATDELQLALARVNGRLPTEAALAGLQALKTCNLGDVSFSLKAVPEAPSITAGSAGKIRFTISGGTPPYLVDLQTSPVTGVSVVQPAPFDTSVFFEITPDAVAGTVSVLVMDASKPTKSMVVPVEILPATSAAVAGESAVAPHSGGLRPTDATSLARAINSRRIFQHAGSIELSVPNPAIPKTASRVELGMRCKPMPAQCIPVDAARKTLAAGVSAPANLAAMLQFNPAPGCLCAP